MAPLLSERANHQRHSVECVLTGWELKGYQRWVMSAGAVCFWPQQSESWLWRRKSLTLCKVKKKASAANHFIVHMFSFECCCAILQRMLGKGPLFKALAFLHYLSISCFSEPYVSFSATFSLALSCSSKCKFTVFCIKGHVCTQLQLWPPRCRPARQ